MTTITFKLNGNDVQANAGETIWQVAERSGVSIPHLCWQPEPGYRADGNCRTCMVEIKGERTLAASCVRTPNEGMEINTDSDRALKAQKTVFELLGADQPKKDVAHDSTSKFWHWADQLDISLDKFPTSQKPQLDATHPAMRVNLDACINCNLCVRACREVQVNDVIGVSGRGSNTHIAFDVDDTMGDSTCVACGECVQACPTGALMPTTAVDEMQHFMGTADKVVDSSCPFCGVGCLTSIHVKDNKVLKVEGRNGPANRKRMCVKGRFGMDYTSHPERLTVPLIRKEGVPKVWDDYVSGADWSTHFREASWEEALDFAAGGFNKIYAEHGSDAIGGYGSAKCSNEDGYLVQKFIRTAFKSNHVDHCARLCHSSSVAALMEGISSGAVTLPFTDAEHSDCVIIIGARPTWNHPVASTYIKQGVKNGTRLIIMDPRKQEITRMAEKHLQFKAGTDVALLSAIVYTIIDEKLYDEQYIQANVDGFEELKENIKDFSPEAMESECGIEANEIRETARIYANAKNSMILWGMGITQHVHGTDNARRLIAMAALTGHIGRPGAGLHPLRGQNNVQGTSDMGILPNMLPGYVLFNNEKMVKKFEENWGMELNTTPGLTAVEILQAVNTGQMKGVYIAGENPAMSDPDTQHAREELASLEHLVIQDIFMTETAFHADVILPTTAFLEKTGTFTNTNRQVQLAHKALEPAGDVKEDWRVTMELANRCGQNWNYANNGEVFEEIRSLVPAFAGISYERLEKEHSVTYPCKSVDEPGQPVLFADGFPTENGRAQLKSVSIRPPAEIPDTEFPLILTTGRLLEHWHTGAMTRRATILDAIEPEPTVHMHPTTMDKFGINAGDLVNVSTRRGSIQLIARVDTEFSEDTIFTSFAFPEAPSNMLTNPKLDPSSKIPEFKFCAVRVEKATTQVMAR